MTNSWYLQVVECNLSNHLEYYSTPLNINNFWNIGFILSILIIVQIFSGLILSTFYSNYLLVSYYSIINILREINEGYFIRYFHINGSSFIFLFSFVHIGKSIFYYSWNFLYLNWIYGIIILCLLIIIGFLGYLLPWGQMSYWGCTVIMNLLNFIPRLIEWIYGNYFISIPTIKRFFILHFILPFIIIIILIFHIFYLHYIGSSNGLGFNHCYFEYFYPYYIFKDYYYWIIILGLFLLNILYFYYIGDPDNGLLVNGMITPLHIVPEWYFLFLYCILKVIPNKYCGFIILINFFIIFILLIGSGEIINIIFYLYFNILLVLVVYLYFMGLFICGKIIPLDLYIYYGLLEFWFLFLVIFIFLDIYIV